jgi:hypothetical protein
MGPRNIEQRLAAAGPHQLYLADQVIAGGRQGVTHSARTPRAQYEQDGQEPAEEYARLHRAEATPVIDAWQMQQAGDRRQAEGA